jgi:hypothetical protein
MMAFGAIVERPGAAHDLDPLIQQTLRPRSARARSGRGQLSRRRSTTGDGACPNFQANGEMMIWSAGYDHGPDLISGGSDDAGGLYDLFWLPTSELTAYYKARAGIG